MPGLRGTEERALAALLSAAQAGDAAAYQALLTGLLPGLRSRLAGDEVRVQHALLRLHRLRATWRPGRSVKAWSEGIAASTPESPPASPPAHPFTSALWQRFARFFARRAGKASSARL